MGEFDHITSAMYASPVMAEFIAMAESGDFSRLDRSGAKRHHFVPQLLLRRFAREHNGNPSIFQMETTSRKAPQRMDIRDAASRHRLYALRDEDGQQSNRHEGYLAMVESHAASAIARLLDDPAGLTPADRATIAFFVALQTMRTPAAAKQIKEVANATFRMLVTEHYSDPRAFAADYRKRRSDAADEEQIERFRQEVITAVRDGSVEVTTEGGGAFALGLQHAAERLPMLLAFDWTLLRAEGGFITSDRGFAIDDPAPEQPWQQQAVFSSPASQTTVPLGERECLLLQPAMHGGIRVRDVDPAVVETINLRTYGWADRHVFGATQEDLVAVRTASRRRPADVVHPRPFCHVFLIDPDPSDSSLGERNLRQGWPAQIPHEGELHDYVVIPTDAPHPELWELADEVTMRRARKRAGVAEDAQLNGRIINNPLDPADFLADD